MRPRIPANQHRVRVDLPTLFNKEAALSIPVFGSGRTLAFTRLMLWRLKVSLSLSPDNDILRTAPPPFRDNSPVVPASMLTLRSRRVP